MGRGHDTVPPLRESMVVVQQLTLDGLMLSVNFLKIDGASASVNEELKTSIGTVKLAASTHTTTINYEYFKNVSSVLARWFSLKATSKTLK